MDTFVIVPALTGGAREISPVANAGCDLCAVHVCVNRGPLDLDRIELQHRAMGRIGLDAPGRDFFVLNGVGRLVGQVQRDGGRLAVCGRLHRSVALPRCFFRKIILVEAGDRFVHTHALNFVEAPPVVNCVD